jgi:hypothetical protein
VTEENEIMLLHASLQLRCNYFLERYARFLLGEGILKAYRSTVNIIWAIQERGMETRLLRRGPGLFQNALYIASTFVLKILRSNYSQLVDAEEGRKAFNASLSLLRKCSIGDNDLAGRFSKILAELWCARPEEASPQRGLTVRTRLGGSLLHDTLWKWREKFGGQSFSAQGMQASSSADSRPARLSNSGRAWPASSVEGNGYGHGGGMPTDTANPPQHDSSDPISQDWDASDAGLVSEISNWCLNGGGFSSLIAADLDGMDFSSDFDTSFLNDASSTNAN